MRPQHSLTARPSWWVRVTSVGWDMPRQSRLRREMTRRSELASWIVLGLLVFDVILLPAGLHDRATLIAQVGLALGCVIAIFGNQRGWVTATGCVLVALIDGGVIFSVLGASNGLQTVYLPAYDLLVIPVMVAATILGRRAAFVVAGVNSCLICLDLFFQPAFGDLAQLERQNGPVPFAVRPIALQIVVATLAYLWVRGRDRAEQRADQESIRASEADERAEWAVQSAQLEKWWADVIRAFLGQIHDVFVKQANGDYSARLNVPSEHPFHTEAMLMNRRLDRLQKIFVDSHAGQEYLSTLVSWLQLLHQRLRAVADGAPLNVLGAPREFPHLLDALVGDIRQIVTRSPADAGASGTTLASPPSGAMRGVVTGGQGASVPAWWDSGSGVGWPAPQTPYLGSHARQPGLDSGVRGPDSLQPLPENWPQGRQ